MDGHELAHIVAAVLLMFVVAGVTFAIIGDAFGLVQVFVFSVIVIGVPIVVKKTIAYALDADVKHEIWGVYHFGFKPKEHFRKERPFGVIVPLVFSFLGVLIRFPLMVMTFLTYETTALKYRAAKRHGFYSYTEMTDWHNGLIGAFGVVSLWLIAMLGYLAGWEFLMKMASYYAFWNMVPVSKLDGTQIFFGNRILWVVLAVISLLFVFYAVMI